jgi:diguanylate cyclase (GGDEF)-like protein
MKKLPARGEGLAELDPVLLGEQQVLARRLDVAQLPRQRAFDVRGIAAAETVGDLVDRYRSVAVVQAGQGDARPQRPVDSVAALCQRASFGRRIAEQRPRRPQPSVGVGELSDGDHIVLGEVTLKFVAGGSMEARYHEALFGLANLDSLTQLCNRRAFREAVDAAVAATAQDPEPLSLAIFDLDHFKQINDVLGHAEGDAALRRLSATLRRQLRPRDVAGRLGGDEFSVLMPRTGPSEAHVWCEQLRQLCEGLGLEGSGLRQPVSLSIGFATWEGAMGGAHEFMRLADMALLRAKDAGRNCVRAAIMGA